MEPKKVLIQFLQYWKRGNKKQMFARTSKTWQATYDKNAFQGTGLTSFEVGEQKQNGPVCDFQIKLNDEPHSVRLLCENVSHKGDVNGDWGVFPGSFREVKPQLISLNDAIDRDIPKGSPERNDFEKELKSDIAIKKVSINDKDIPYSEDNVVKMD